MTSLKRDFLQPNNFVFKLIVPRIWIDSWNSEAKICQCDLNCRLSTRHILEGVSDHTVSPISSANLDVKNHYHRQCQENISAGTIPHECEKHRSIGVSLDIFFSKERTEKSEAVCSKPLFNVLLGRETTWTLRKFSYRLSTIERDVWRKSRLFLMALYEDPPSTSGLSWK